jgi:hypothetical protein
MSIKVPKLNTKSSNTTNTNTSNRRYKAPTRADLMKKYANLKKNRKGTSLDKDLRATLIKNVLYNTKKG